MNKNENAIIMMPIYSQRKLLFKVVDSMRKLSQIMTFVVVSLLLLTSIATAGEFTVMPGHSIGRIWLGAPHTKIRKIMGKPYLIQRDGSLTIEFWRVQKSTGDYVSAVYKRGRVVQLETNSSRFRTPHGVSVRSTLGYIRRVFGSMKVLSYGANYRDSDVAEHAAHYYDSIKRGIAFELELGARPDIAADVVPHALFVHRREHRFLLVNGKET